MLRHSSRSAWPGIVLFAATLASGLAQASATDASAEDKAYPQPIAAIDDAQNERLINCMVAATTSSKLLEERSSGKTNEEIVQRYRDTLGEGAADYARKMLSNLDADKPESNDLIGYGGTVYRKCLGGIFTEDAMSIAEYCYHQSQFVQLAFSFRSIGEPMEKVYGKVPVPDDTKAAYDALLARAGKVEASNGPETIFRLSTYYRCLGHPERSPVG